MATIDAYPYLVLASLLALATWTWLTRKLWRDPRLEVPAHSTAASWGVLEVFACPLLYLALHGLLIVPAVHLLGWDLSTDAEPLLREQRIQWLHSVAALATVIMVAGTIALRAPAGFRVGGWSIAHAASDLTLALHVGLVVIPLIYLLHLGVSQLPGMEYEHPFIKLLLDSEDIGLWVTLTFSAIIVAPITEEFFFREILQGGLERFFSARPRLDALPGGVESEQPVPASVRSRLLAHVPIGISSLCFGLAHASHGGGWIALVMFAAILGYLYHATHRLLPCILLHMLFNAISLITLGVSVWYRHAAG